MKAMLLQMATMRSGTIVFMKNDEKTRTADNQPAITINIATSIQESKGTPVCGQTVVRRPKLRLPSCGRSGPTNACGEAVHRRREVGAGEVVDGRPIVEREVTKVAGCP
jgi:hypothetical protein